MDIKEYLRNQDKYSGTADNFQNGGAFDVTDAIRTSRRIGLAKENAQLKAFTADSNLTRAIERNDTSNDVNIARTIYQIAKNVSSAYSEAHKAAIVIIPAIAQSNHVSDANHLFDVNNLVDANHLVDVTRDANVAIESRDNAYAAARATDYAFTDARKGLVSYDEALAKTNDYNQRAIYYAGEARAAYLRVEATCEMLIREKKARQDAAVNAARDESIRNMIAHSKAINAERAAAKLAKEARIAAKLAKDESAAATDDQQGGAYKNFNNDEYYAKYMKYKTKYLELKL